MTVGYEKISSHAYDHKCNQSTPGYKGKTVVGNGSRWPITADSPHISVNV